MPEITYVEVGTHVSDLHGRVGRLEEVDHETGKGVVTYGTQDRTTPKLTLDTATLARVIPPPLSPEEVEERQALLAKAEGR